MSQRAIFRVVVSLNFWVAFTMLSWLLAFAGPSPLPAQSPPQNVTYLRWLKERSMLHQSRKSALGISGKGVQWRHPFGQPQPLEAVRQSSVWLLDYAGSVITRPGQSVLATWGNPVFWDALHDLGVDLLHTGPVNLSGGIVGKKHTPTIDGWFDRISLDLDPALGSEQEYRRMVEIASKRSAAIAGDLVPLHTGMGADFQLALRAYRDYPGMYVMVEIRKEDWGLLPKVDGEFRVAHLPRTSAAQLARKGYIPGAINSNDAAKGARDWSGWSASGEVLGADGQMRRWVYLHFFKQQQPALNWSDPSCAAQRVVFGDVVRTVQERRTRVVRLDAVPFLGIEPNVSTGESVHFKHPLSVTGTNYLAFLIRKLGGWSFQELNIPLRELHAFTKNGPDLSYDFATRAQCLHALLTEDAAPLRLAFRWFLEAEMQPLAFVHDLQNHDEITYQLTELAGRGKEVFQVGARKVTGKELREAILEEMRRKTSGRAAPYNRLYRPERDGLATTFVGFLAPALGVNDPYRATPEERRLIRRGHLLLAAANALQPGVFGMSSWDLVGALPIPEESVAKSIADGDYRWINRGGVDLIGTNPQQKQSAFGVPRAQSLYGSLPEQLKDPKSFASGLKKMLTARKKVRLAESELVAVPEPRQSSLCFLLLKLPDGRPALTVLNFGRRAVTEELDLSGHKGFFAEMLRAEKWTDLMSEAAAVSARGDRLSLRMPALTGTTLVPDKSRE